jgi:hypothetical protein
VILSRLPAPLMETGLRMTNWLDTGSYATGRGVRAVEMATPRSCAIPSTRRGITQSAHPGPPLVDQLFFDGS